jgi:DNA-binding transcriptional ArsR family regulator
MTRIDCIPALKALGEETRLRILRVLFKEKLSVNEVSELLNASQYNISKHLRIMRDAVCVKVLSIPSRAELLFKRDLMLRGDAIQIDRQHNWAASFGGLFFCKYFALESWVTQPIHQRPASVTVKFDFAIPF